MFFILVIIAATNVFGQAAVSEGGRTLGESIQGFWTSTGFANVQLKYLAMIFI